MTYWKVQLIDIHHPNRKKYAETIFFTSAEAYGFKRSYSQKMKENYVFKVMRFEGNPHKAIAKALK